MSNPINTCPQPPNAPLTDERTWKDYFRDLANNAVSVFASTPKITTATAGTAAALPSAPVGYVLITIQNTNYKVPYYNV